MSEPAIRVNGLGKRYRIGAQVSYRTLREQIYDLLAAPLQLLRRRKRQPTIWALRDVSFEVDQGEVIGIIGRNGAGKSTLLKILSRITEPTEGEADLRGRVGSLLEVGTGFHPELTGRENVHLNGAILGMKRSEIVRKFDAIVSFAEIEEFLDTPVKRYSSGMYLRLAFAIAAHLEPEILLVDEVLAVGDAAFQKKCLGKMENVAREGRTVLFVSHNMAAITSLCKRSLVIHRGSLEFDGSSETAVDHYHRKIEPLQSLDPQYPHVLYQRSLASEKKDSKAYITAIELLDQNGQPKPSVSTWEPLTVRLHFCTTTQIHNLHVFLRISNNQGTRIAELNSNTHLESVGGHEDQGFADCRIRCLPLAAGTYRLGACLCVPHREMIDFEDDRATFTVHPADVYGSGRAPTAPLNLIAIEHVWRLGAPNPGERIKAEESCDTC